MKQKCRSRCPTLSARLVWLFVVMAAAIAIILAAAMGWAFRSHFEEGIRPHLVRYLEYIQNDLGSPPDYQKALALTQHLPLEISFASRDQHWSTGETEFDLNAIHFYRESGSDGIEYGFGHNNEREFLVSRHADYSVIFSVPHHGIGWYKIIPVVLILMSLIVLYHATRRLFAPIEEIKYGIERIGAGDFSHRIDVHRRDELGELGRSINGMAEEIQKMMEAKRQLLLAISHELRTPLTRAKVAAEMLDDPQQRNDINRELNEMEQLIDELLETERLRHHGVLNKAEISLNALIKTVLKNHFSAHRLETELPLDEVIATVDVTRIKLLLKNLIDNALRHNPPNALPPKITLTRGGDEVTMSVSDFGQGIAADQLPYLTDPFYRVDAARQRQTGGYGLGLYLCRVIAETHGGRLRIESEVGRGTRVTVQLPRTTFERSAELTTAATPGRSP